MDASPEFVEICKQRPQAPEEEQELKWIGNKDTPKPVKRLLKELLDAIPEQTEFECSYLEAIYNLLGVHEDGECSLCPFEDSHEVGYQHEMFAGTEYMQISGCKLKSCWIPRAKKLALKMKLFEPEHPDKAKRKYERENKRVGKLLNPDDSLSFKE